MASRQPTSSFSASWQSLPKITRMEIHLPELPTEDDFVTISMDEYAALIATSTTMNIIERWAKAHNAFSKIDFVELMILLGVEKEKDK